MAGDPVDWRAVHAELSRRDESSLRGEELDLLAESLFWLDDPDASIAVRGRAFTAHVGAGDHRAAAMAAWQLFYDHALVGDDALASGWLERARQQCEHIGGSVADGFLSVADSDHAAARGDLESALAHADRAVAIGRAAGDADLTAMAQQARGRVLVACGRHDEGLAALDDAMVAAVNGELAPLFTGWVYCNALSTCHDLADLDRAVQWSEAAAKWCGELRDGQLYPGICRVHVVELASLRGNWTHAASQARLACDELTAHDPRYAGEAHYLIGDLHRMNGDLDRAEEEFIRAHQLGRAPHPGLARVRLSQGRVDAAVKAIRLALDTPPAAPLRRAELLVALADAEVLAGDAAAAREAARCLAELADDVPSDYLRALWFATDATVLLAEREAAGACRRAGDAVALFQRLGLPYDEARARTVRGTAAAAIDDGDTAELELHAALDIFRRIGAGPDARRVTSLLGEAPPSPLSSRETEVLRLVARGGTNKEVAAELVVSEHTVARHLSNIYTKLGVGSRAAATAFAYEHSLI